MKARDRKPKFFSIYLIYSRAHLASGLVALDRLHRRLFSDLERFDIVVDNGWRSPVEWAHQEGRVVVSGDNRLREFSGWDAGLDKLAREHAPRDHDVVALANDTFHRNYGEGYLGLFKRRTTRGQLKSGALVGWVDGYPQDVRAMGFRFREWIRSSLVLTTYGSLRRLLPLAADLGHYFSDGGSTFFSPGAALDARYRAYLERWLFGGSTDGGAVAPEFRECWHSADALSEANARGFRVKAQAIMCEHALSARAASLDMPIFDVRRGIRIAPPGPAA